MSQYLNEGAVDLIITFRFIKLLVTPWKKTDAFKEGVIDADGKLLVKGKDQTSAQKKTYTSFHKLVFNIKRLMSKVPFGRTRIASYAAALYLLKEEHGMAEEDILKVLEDLGHDTSIDLTEEIKDIHEGQHILNNDISDYIKGNIIHLDSKKPVTHFAGVPIYKTRENIFISAENIL
jgi:hypothetical protein|tara:strand:+ start:940 stop:1470 length:531 start_codon:yes stop_codon:yes gene_type:complete